MGLELCIESPVLGLYHTLTIIHWMASVDIEVGPSGGLFRAEVAERVTQ